MLGGRRFSFNSRLISSCMHRKGCGRIQISADLPLIYAAGRESEPLRKPVSEQSRPQLAFRFEPISACGDGLAQPL
jgi:hypothetical protein